MKNILFCIALIGTSIGYGNSNDESELSMVQVKETFESKIIWTEDHKSSCKSELSGMRLAFPKKDRKQFDKFFNNVSSHEEASLRDFARAIMKGEEFRPDEEALAYAVDWPDPIRGVAIFYIKINFIKDMNEEFCMII